MPKLNGIGVLRALEAEPQVAQRHAYLLLTARSRMSMPLLTWTPASSITVVRKPFDVDQLLDHIRQAAQQLDERAPEGAD